MKYNVIYADPPWRQKAGRKLGTYKVVEGVQIFSDGGSNRSEDLPYNTMSYQDIVDLPVHTFTADNCHLYMWVTNKYLMKAGEVVRSWGFNYSTTLVWTKKPLGGGLGGTFKVTTEFLIFATKGKVTDLVKEKIKGTWFEVTRPYVNGYPCHSKKPKFFYELIEKVSKGNKLELFAREERAGWDSWGDEVKCDINIYNG